MKVFQHFKKICIHKYYVGKYCFKMGLYWQGLTHDLSKFSFVEFWESAKYYQGGRSPIDACKEDKGYSLGWQHHKGRNKHHYEYWVDSLDSGGVALIMPEKYAMELVADYLGAGAAYMGKDFSYAKEYEWWLNKKSHDLKMHEVVQNALTGCFRSLAELEKIKAPKGTYKAFFKHSVRKWYRIELWVLRRRKYYKEHMNDDENK